MSDAGTHAHRERDGESVGNRQRQTGADSWTACPVQLVGNTYTNTRRPMWSSSKVRKDQRCGSLSDRQTTAFGVCVCGYGYANVCVCLFAFPLRFIFVTQFMVKGGGQQRAHCSRACGSFAICFAALAIISQPTANCTHTHTQMRESAKQLAAGGI